MPANQINSDSKMEALEIEDELIDAIEEAGPGGLGFVQGSEIVGLNYDRFYLLVHQLGRLGRVKIERSQVGNQARIILPGWEPPHLATLTELQRKVLSVLCSEMDRDGLARISFNQIKKRAGCSWPSFAVERLDYKGFIEIVEAGSPTSANLYRVYPDQDGPRGLSSTWFRRR